MSNLIPIRAAAKEIRRSIKFVREHLIETGLLPAYRCGGSPTAPRLRVDALALQQAYREATAYRPAGQPRRATRRLPARALHPAAQGMIDATRRKQAR